MSYEPSDGAVAREADRLADLVGTDEYWPIVIARHTLREKHEARVDAYVEGFGFGRYMTPPVSGCPDLVARESAEQAAARAVDNA